MSDKEMAFVSFTDDDGKIVKGLFDLIEETANYVKIRSKDNILTIPYHKLNKLKMKGGNKI